MPCRDLRFSVGCVYARMDMDHGVTETVCRAGPCPSACPGPVCVKGTVRAWTDDTFNKHNKPPKFPTYMRLVSTATS